MVKPVTGSRVPAFAPSYVRTPRRQQVMAQETGAQPLEREIRSELPAWSLSLAASERVNIREVNQRDVFSSLYQIKTLKHTHKYTHKINFTGN